MIDFLCIFLSPFQLAFLWPHFAKAFTLFFLPLRLQEDNMGKEKNMKKVSFLLSLDLLYHSTVCSFYINWSQYLLLWYKFTHCFCDRFCHALLSFFFIDNWSLEIFWCIFCVDLFESTIEKFEILCITWNRLLCVVPTSCTFFLLENNIEFYEREPLNYCMLYLYIWTKLIWLISEHAYNRKSLKSRHFAFVYVQAADGVDIIVCKSSYA